MEKQPNSLTCFVCGLENENGLKLTFYSDGEGRVVSEYIVSKMFEGYPGVVHGGIIASMLDEALGRAFMWGDSYRFMYTARITVRYRKNVPSGQPLRIVGTVVKDRGRMGESKAELFGPYGELLAEAEGLVVEIPEELHDGEELQALGWRVYPD
jgi:acyl-coenzyme A thioesterase PaaI-like protein